MFLDFKRVGVGSLLELFSCMGRLWLLRRSEDPLYRNCRFGVIRGRYLSLGSLAKSTVSYAMAKFGNNFAKVELNISAR